MKNKGCFITFEGGEGVGKTTLINKIEEYLQSINKDYISTREPGGTPLGEDVRKILLSQDRKMFMSQYTELTLFLASRSQHIEQVILPAIQSNKIVLCDRFNDSSVAYQGHARGLGMDIVKQFCSFISQGLEPDLTFYLDLDPEIGLFKRKKRDEHDRIEAEEINFHNKIRDGFLIIAKNNPTRFHVIDARQTKEEVFEEVISSIKQFLHIK
jgi:dTMP kinase